MAYVMNFECDKSVLRQAELSVLLDLKKRKDLYKPIKSKLPKLIF